MIIFSKPIFETWRYRVYVIKKNPPMIIGILLISLLIFTAIFAPFFRTYDPLEVNPSNRLERPSSKHLLGTDQLGRDVFVRMIYGARITIKIGFAVIFFAFGIGMTMGLISLYNKVFDEVIMRVTDAFISFPYVILAMALCMILGPSLDNAILAMSIVWWPTYARLIRGQGLSVGENLYIEAAKSLGASKSRIIFRHILPNSWAPVLIQATQDFGRVVIYSAGLSFIGLGAQPPIPEWGAMISEGQPYLRIAWWCSTFPGLGIVATVLGFNLLGDGLRDIFDPKARSI